MTTFYNARAYGRPITIYDEGVSLTTNVGSINFTGAGVAGTALGDDVTETINGGLGGTSIVTVSGTIDDLNTAFTADTQPALLVINGGTYKTTGGTITWTYVAGAITSSVAVGTGGTIYGIA